ncbi:hypothetical protein SAY86_002848 [Trapa natans]|uniref:Uncharacterized protein n=1 Tax=Trapa natans TaxID=22666 RepID=A0AAN7LJW4_TRANT|nr:hypothetical protein SAY86_002848 [Trapa natans]
MGHEASELRYGYGKGRSGVEASKRRPGQNPRVVPSPDEAAALQLQDHDGGRVAHCRGPGCPTPSSAYGILYMLKEARNQRLRRCQGSHRNGQARGHPSQDVVNSVP